VPFGQLLPKPLEVEAADIQVVDQSGGQKYGKIKMTNSKSMNKASSGSADLGSVFAL
jgi:hypothetical protein